MDHTHTKSGAVVPVEEYRSCGHLSGIIDSFASCRTTPILFERMESCQSSWIKSNHARLESSQIWRACVWYQDRDSLVTHIRVFGRYMILITFRERTKAGADVLAVVFGKSDESAISIAQ
jgi:hypothetical protein